MVEFLSPEWLAALDRAASEHAVSVEDSGEGPLVIEQRVEADDSHEPVTFHLTLGEQVRVQPGPADQPGVVFTQDRVTARAIASGQSSAQREFMTGGLRVSGDLQRLLGVQDALEALGAAFAAVRTNTDFGPEPGPDA